MHLRADEMVLLLNHLPDQCQVFAPLLGCTLFELDLSQRQAQVRDIIRQADFSALLRARRQGQPADLAREFPDYDLFWQPFRSSGLHRPTNWDTEIVPLLKEAEASNPARGDAVYYFGFDNNVLRTRLCSLQMCAAGTGDARHNLAVSAAVRKELTVRDDKISGDFLQAFHDAVPDLNIPTIFGNQNRLADRMRIQALNEFNAILGVGTCELLKTPRRRVAGSGEADRQIIQSYADFAQMVGRRVVLFSADNEFVLQTAGLPNLTGQIVQYPPRSGRTVAGAWEEVGRLLYDLTVIFGRLEISANTGALYLYGVWQRKGEPHWRREEVRVTAPEVSVSLLRNMERTQAILRAAQKKA